MKRWFPLAQMKPEKKKAIKNLTHHCYGHWSDGFPGVQYIAPLNDFSRVQFLSSYPRSDQQTYPYLAKIELPLVYVMMVVPM